MKFLRLISLLACSLLRIHSGSWTRTTQTPQDLGNIGTFGVKIVWVDVTAQDARHCRIRPLVFPLPPEDTESTGTSLRHTIISYKGLFQQP